MDRQFEEINRQMESTYVCPDPTCPTNQSSGMSLADQLSEGLFEIGFLFASDGQRSFDSTDSTNFHVGHIPYNVVRNYILNESDSNSAASSQEQKDQENTEKEKEREQNNF